MKTTRYLLPILLLLLPFVNACELQTKETLVTYEITGLENDYEVTYLDEDEASVNLTVDPTGEDYVWSYSFAAGPAEVVYLYAEYYNEDVDPQQFKFRILLDGKVFKEAFGYDKEEWVNGEHVFYVKRTGSIPVNQSILN